MMTVNATAKLHDKRVLFFSPKFFSYETILKEELIKMGADVVFFDERPSNTTLGKALLRINRNLMKSEIKRYYDYIMSQIDREHFDYIFICQAEATPTYFLEFLKEHFPTAQRILYLWDSVNNKVNTLEKVAYFNRIYSFDIQDCKQYHWHFRPLFFDESYTTMKKKKVDRCDLFFVGTIHSDRYKILEQIKKSFLKQKKTVFYYYYIPSKLMYYYYKYVKKIIPHSKKSDFNYRALDQKTLQEKLSGALIVVDIQHPQQTGLTMRTIEMLGAQKKLITTNPSIKHYDFYDPKNICVIDRQQVCISEIFLNSPYHKIDSSIYNHYSISYFLSEIFGLTNQEVVYYH